MIHLQLIGKTRVLLSNEISILNSATSLLRLVRHVGESGAMKVDRLALGRAICPPDCADPIAWLRVQLFRLAKKMNECGEHEALHYTDSQVWFNPGVVSSDLATLRKIKSELISGKRTDSLSKALEFLQRSMSGVVAPDDLYDFEINSWRKIGWEVAQLVLELSKRSLDSRERRVCLDAISVIQKASAITTANTELYMQIFANLGSKEELIDGFVSLEEELLDRSGLTANSATTRLFDTLLAGMDRPGVQPFQVPVETGRFVGGQQLDETIFKQIPDTVVQVTGLPGVGKTRQLSRAAGKFIKENPMIKLIWADLKQTTVMSLREYLTHYPADIVVIDSFQSDQKSGVLALINQEPTCSVIVAGDYTDWPLPVRHYTISPLTCSKDSPSEASDLLLDFATRASFDIEHSLAYRLSHACSGHPEALKIAAQYCSSLPPATLLEFVNSTSRIFSNPWNRISDFLNAILGHLSDSASEALALMCVSREPIVVQALKDLTGVSVFDLNHLVVSGLVSIADNQEARISSTLRECVEENIAPDWRRTSLQRVANRILFQWSPEMRSSSEACAYLPTVGQRIVAELWQCEDTTSLAFALLRFLRPTFAPLTPVLLPPEALVEKTMRYATHTNGVQELVAAGTLLFFSGVYARVVELCQFGLSLCPTPSEQIELESQLGLALTKVGSVVQGQEIMISALTRAEESGAIHLRPRIHYNLAISLIYDSGNYCKAIDHFDSAIALMEHVPSLSAQMELVQSRALAQFMIDQDLPPLIETLQDLEKTCFHMKMFAERGWIVANIGEAHKRAGNSVESLAYIVAGAIIGLAGGYTFEYRRQLLASIGTVGVEISADSTELAGRCKVFAARLGGPVVHPEARSDKDALDDATWKDRVRLQGLTPTAEETLQLLEDIAQLACQREVAQTVFAMTLRPDVDLLRYDSDSKRLCANRDLIVGD